MKRYEYFPDALYVKITAVLFQMEISLQIRSLKKFLSTHCSLCVNVRQQNQPKMKQMFLKQDLLFYYIQSVTVEG